MMLCLAKRVSSSPAIVSLLTAPRKSHLLHRCCSSSASTLQNPDPKATNFTMADYLISSFGFSPDKAAKVSKSIAHTKSPTKPDSVIGFLKQQGFTEAEVKRLVTWQPTILCSSVINTLQPNLDALREIGLSTSTLTQIILCNPQLLNIRTYVPRIKLWMDFLGGSEAAIVRAFKNNGGGFTSQDFAPKINLLESRGISPHDIHRIVLTVPRFMTYSNRLMEEVLKRAMQLGFHPGSSMFVRGLHVVSSNSSEALNKKMGLLKSFGWSADVILSALQKSPTIFTMSEKTLQAKMEFLVGELRCDASYVASVPAMLSCSLDKRMRPRHRVLSLLESNGLCNKIQSFSSSVLIMNGNKFAEKYILPYKEKIPGLHEAYIACLCLRAE